MSNANDCRHDMRPGIYLAQTWRRGHPQSMSAWPGGPGVVRRCLKCCKCGHSVRAD